MPELVVGDRRLETDPNGFIQQPELWDEEVALALARTDGVEQLTEDHWKVINYLRGYYLQYDIAPTIRKLCKNTGFKLVKIFELFPRGPEDGACKVAGLPRPDGCV